MTRISYEDVYAVLLTALVKTGFDGERAKLCAQLFTDSSRDGVYSHGLNRFPRFMEMIQNGVIDIHARPELSGSFGALERWDGTRGPGNLNAHACMERAISLSREHGMGGVALANTNHWMRGGSYGWQAADAGVIGICWTNTMPNLPPWGASEPRLGNNPLVIAVPRAEGHIVLDMAMSQFSYGTLESHRMRHRHVQNNVTFCSGHGDHQRVVTKSWFAGAPGREVRHRVGPTDANDTSVGGLPAITATPHPVIRIGQSHTSHAVFAR